MSYITTPDFWAVMSLLSSGVFGGYAPLSEVTNQLEYYVEEPNITIDHDVQFVSCSATIANPQVQMHKIFGLELDDIEAITEDGAPAGEKHFLIWNPPLVDPESSNLRRHSSLSEAITLMEYLMINGIRVILFCKVRLVSSKLSPTADLFINTQTRKVCELVCTSIKPTER